MSNQVLVPRTDKSGSLGTPTKSWGTGSFYKLILNNNDNELNGSFSGSFQGDGSNLTGVAVSGGGSGSFSGSFQGDGSNLTGVVTNITNVTSSLNVFKVNSGISKKTTRISSSTYTVLQNDYRVGIKYSLTGSSNIQLPLALDVPNQEFRFKDEEGNANTNNQHIVISGSDTIDGALSASLSNDYESFILYNDGVSKWFVE